MKIDDELAELKAKYGDAVTVTAIDDENLLTVIKDEVDFQFGFLIEKPLLFWYMGDDRHALSYVEQKLNEGSFHTLVPAVECIFEELDKCTGLIEGVELDELPETPAPREPMPSVDGSTVPAQIMMKANDPASKRIAKDYGNFMTTYKSDDPNAQFTLDIDEANIHICTITVNWITKDTHLYHQLNRAGVKIKLEVTFPKDYPFEPPFVRVLEPILSGGNVHPGGAICLEFLTKQKWNPAWNLESTTIQIAAALGNGNRGTRMSMSGISTPNSKEMALRSFQKIERLQPWYNYRGDKES